MCKKAITFSKKSMKSVKSCKTENIKIFIQNINELFEMRKERNKSWLQKQTDLALMREHLLLGLNPIYYWIYKYTACHHFNWAN